MYRDFVSPTPQKHLKCRGGIYTRTRNVKRFEVADNQVSWKVAYSEYDPPEFTSDKVLEEPEWADPDISGLYPNTKPPLVRTLKFNGLDERVNRKSHMGPYRLDTKGIPRYSFFFTLKYDRFHC